MALHDRPISPAPTRILLHPTPAPPPRYAQKAQAKAHNFYMLAAQAAAAQVVDGTLSDLDRDMAAIVLKNIFSLLDKDDEAQVLAMQYISQHQPADGSANSGIPWLAEIIRSLSKDRKVGWAAVVAWARHADEVGRHNRLLENVAALHARRSDHRSRNEPGWLEAIDEARTLVIQSCDDALLKAKQGDSSVAETALDCAGFDKGIMGELRGLSDKTAHSPIAGMSSPEGRPNGNEL